METVNKFGKRILLLLLAVLLCASFGSANENITYTYRTVAGDVLNSNSSFGAAQVNITLPNTTWNLEITNNNSRFKIELDGLNHTNFSTLDLEAKEIDTSGTKQNYTGAVFGVTNAHRYIVYYGYGFNASGFVDRDYDVTLYYSDFSAVKTPYIFKCPFNFSDGEANTADCTQISTPSTYDTVTKKVWGTAQNFSSFFLAEDRCVDGIKNYDEGGADCGGACPTACPTTSYSTGGGGGGGGGGGMGVRVIYVTPTPEGASVQVYQGDELIILFDGGEYHMRVAKVASMQVQLKDLATFITYDLAFGVDKRIGLKSFLSDDVTVRMQVSNNFAMLTFTTIQKRTPVFALLPAKPRAAEQPITGQPTAGGTAPVAPAARPATAPAAAAPEETLQAPESPIDLWTILAAVAFVVLLIGGFALYRVRSNLAQPPTVTGTGMPPPVTSVSVEAAPSHPAQPQPLFVVERPPEVVDYVQLTVEQKLELEKFVFHALSQGFSEDVIKESLIRKGWPKGNVVEIMDEVSPK